jgi:predicted RNA-binding Zn ribbon-like protein
MATGPRAQAPESLRLVQAFVNSVDLEEGRDGLAGPAGLEEWLLGHSLLDVATGVSEEERARAVAMREALRALLLANGGAAPDPSALEALDRVGARLEVRFGPDGAELAPVASGVDGALARILAAVYDSMLEGTWLRLKACRNDGCRWAFYDSSKNRSGVWCSMAVCGSRAKSRAYRARRVPRG